MAGKSSGSAVMLLTPVYILCFGLLPIWSAGGTPGTPVKEAGALARRVLGNRAADFVFTVLPGDTLRDVFEISSSGSKILIGGNSAVDMASGLNWYLKHYCRSQYTITDGQLNLPRKLPVPEQKIRIRTPYRYRYFFNFCTFSYTMAWWNWKEWERQIDWMAMNGINLPLAVTGQEEIWYEVYKDLGLTEEQISGFLAGPAYLPWGWMGNIDGFGGPLPKSWMAGHAELQKKILERERALGMTPVLQGFTGHVPPSLAEKFPGVKIHRTGNWSAGFGGTCFLDPGEELFRRIGKLFIEKQTALYGTDHYYAADCFNEVDPDSNDPGFLASMSRNVYASMSSADPQAIWVLQAWFLYYQKEFWKEPQSRAFLGAVPDDRMLVLDLWGERYPVWKSKSAFYGKPWIWNVLYNFGGRTSMNGNLKAMARNLSDVTESREKGKFSGIGMTMEYFGNNPVVEEYVMDQVWAGQLEDPARWIEDYVVRRYGSSDQHAQKAWQYMLGTVYGTHSQTGTFLCERPGFFDPKASYRSSPVPRYNQDTLIMALDELLACPDRYHGLETYSFDLVNLTRQALGPLALKWIRETEKAYQGRDAAAIRKYRDLFCGLITDMDDLLSTRREYLLGRWTEDAKAWASTPEESALYEWNARNLVTLWGAGCTEGEADDLNNYALKQWAGMFRNYHLVRWTKFFGELEEAVKQGKEWDRPAFYRASCEWEKAWSSQHTPFSTVTRGDPFTVSRELWKKYRTFLINP